MFEWLSQPVAAPDAGAMEAARQRQARLTKPAGALGRLERLAIRLAGLRGRALPAVERARIVVFAADHGVAAAGVSAYPPAVTAQMVRNFSAGGAAISVQARALGAALEVVNVGVTEALEPLPGVIGQPVGAGSADFCHAEAMSAVQLAAALRAGQDAVARGVAAGMDLFIGGEMGIGNTTVATAVAAAWLQVDPALLAGAGTGMDAAGIGHKAEVVRRALARHRAQFDGPLDILRCVGGLELAALTGACLAAGQAGVPVLVDGFIVSTAALLAVAINPALRPWLLFSHLSAERGHGRVLAALEARPLLALEMRLGEGSGAACALPLLQLACRLHGEMATFDEASVETATRAGADAGMDMQ